MNHQLDFAMDNGKLYLIESIDMSKKDDKSSKLETYGAAFKFDDLAQGLNGNIEPYSMVVLSENNSHGDLIKILKTYSTVVRYNEEKEKSKFFAEMRDLIEPTKKLIKH